MEKLLMGLFSINLIFSVLKGLPLYYPLLLGYALFFGYGLKKNYSIRELLSFSLEGLKKVKTILTVFLLIGIMTALWRASGTTAYLVEWGTAKMRANMMPLMGFLLACLVSFLTGTSFGSAASLGMVLMSMAKSLGVSPALMGGALLSGVYFGDRCSPVSTSALLVSETTGTDLYKNIATMFKTGLIPFIISIAAYLFLGMGEITAPFIKSDVFSKAFDLNVWVLLPAAVMLILSFFRIGVKFTIIGNILSAALIAYLIQGLNLMEILKVGFFGYHPQDILLDELIGGGGIFSMIQAFFIVGISSAYMGILRNIGFFQGIKESISQFKKSSSFPGVLLTSIIGSFITCNQSLTILLAGELTEHIEEDPYLLASHLENSAVVIPPLVPWSIASALPLAAMGATKASIPFAFYLYLLPLITLIKEKSPRKG